MGCVGATVFRQARELVIHVLHSFQHYWDHMQPIYARLPDSLQGTVSTSRREILEIWRPGDLVMVAGGIDVHNVRELPKVYVEHGAGQVYPGDYRSAHHPSYSGGGMRHRNVICYLAPSEAVAARWRPYAPAYVVGCPKLSDIHRTPRQKVAAITFHFPATVCPEAGSAWPAWSNYATSLVSWLEDDGWEVWAHEHPRWDGEVIKALSGCGALPVKDSETILSEASLLIADNTSLMYEFAALGGDVIALNSPDWRRDVHHGLRFWDYIPGHDFTSPGELFSRPPSRWINQESRNLAQRAAHYCYAYISDAAWRAASVVAQLPTGK